MRIGRLALMACLLVGCATGYDGEREAVSQQLRAAWSATGQFSSDPSERIGLVYETYEYQQAARRRDSLLLRPPSIRWSDDSLARYDSLAYAYMLGSRVSSLFYSGDTTEAVFAYLEAFPWLQAFSPFVEADQARRLAETIGDALGVTHSPNMARISYQAFERAKRLAADYGDPHYIHLADSSYKATARRVLTMPDSVRAAFGPPPDRPARVPWMLATLAAAFIAVGVAGRHQRARHPAGVPRTQGSVRADESLRDVGG